MFDTIPGNTRVKGYIRQMIKKEAIGQSLLFAGPDSAHKEQFAKELAHYLLGEYTKQHHPDLYIYRPEGKVGMHSIDAMRRFAEEVYLAPLEAKLKVFIIIDADRMLPTSSNALLKTFEEPAPHSIIILTSDHPTALLPTIISRCRVIRFEANGLSLIQSEKMIQILVGPPFTTWNQLSEAAAELAEEIQKKQSESEESLRDEAIPEDLELTATQKQAIEKEVEGALSMKLIQETQNLLEATLSWFRDLELLHTKGDLNLLLNPEWKAELELAYQRGERLPLEQVERFVIDAQTSINRSTPLQSILETLLIQLKRL